MLRVAVAGQATASTQDWALIAGRVLTFYRELRLQRLCGTRCATADGSPLWAWVRSLLC